MDKSRTMVIEKTISEIIHDGIPEEVMQLRGYGIDIGKNKKDEQCIFISSNHAVLRKQIFKGSRWENSWYQSLCRLPGVEKNISRRFGAHVSKCVAIPLSVIRSKEKSNDLM